jgi:hypothetical protein
VSFIEGSDNGVVHVTMKCNSPCSIAECSSLLGYDALSVAFQRIIVSEDKGTLILSKHQEELTKGNSVTFQKTYDYMVSRLCPLFHIQKRT